MYVESQSDWSILKSNNFSNKVSQTIFDSAILVFGINLAGYNIVITLVCPSVHPFVCLSVHLSSVYFNYATQYLKSHYWDQLLTLHVYLRTLLT